MKASEKNSSILSRVQECDLREVLLYGSYSIRQCKLQRLIMSLTDGRTWHIFECVPLEEIKLKIIGYSVYLIEHDEKLLQFLCSLLEYAINNS